MVVRRTAPVQEAQRRKRGVQARFVNIFMGVWWRVYNTFVGPEMSTRLVQRTCNYIMVAGKPDVSSLLCVSFSYIV
jgi:hypothetical protein